MADTTVESPPSGDEGSPNLEPIVLTVVWGADSRERVGDTILLSHSATTSPTTVGRGHKLVRIRPGQVDERGALHDPQISREQLHLAITPHGNLHVRNVGRAPLYHQGLRCNEATVQEGDVLRISRRLLLVAERRTPRPDPPPAGLHPYGQPDLNGMVGESIAMWTLRTRVAAYAALEGEHVLVYGESGAGKERVAAALHSQSPRRRGPYISHNAATFPEGLVDAELFGHERNYPNPGMPARRGLIGEADGGTLFLDEIGDMPRGLQSHLLRVLDAQGEYRPLGGKVQRSDFRLVAATLRDLTELRPDLLARIPLRIRVPPLRERRSDLPWLIEHFIQTEPALSNWKDRKGNVVSWQFMEGLLCHPLPANVRELRTLIFSALNETPIGQPLRWPLADPSPPPTAPSAPRRKTTAITEQEFRRALAHHPTHTAAADALGITRQALYRLKERFGDKTSPTLPDLYRPQREPFLEGSRELKPADALMAAQEALARYRTITEPDPDAFLDDRARLCGAVGWMLATLDRADEAAAAFAEGVAAIADHLDAVPKRFSSLARSLLRDLDATHGAVPHEYKAPIALVRRRLEGFNE